MVVSHPRPVRSRRSRLVRATPGSIVGAQSGRRVDVPNGSTADGTQVQRYGCSGVVAAGYR